PDEQVPDLNLVRKKTLLVASNISNLWSSIARSIGQAGLQELRLLLAGQDGMLCDLLDEERAITEDTTIFVKSNPKKRRHSSTPDEERKRHCQENKPKLDERRLIGSHQGEPEAPAKLADSRRIWQAAIPEAGELYYAWHKQSQRWLVALVLSLTNLRNIGISCTIETLGLSKNVPDCVVFDITSGQFEWRNGYEDGGPSSHARKYPVVYFMGPRFPESRATDWIHVRDFRALDKSRLQPSNVPCYRAVRAFLERCSLYRAFEARKENFDTLDTLTNQLSDRKPNGAHYCSDPRPSHGQLRSAAHMWDSQFTESSYLSVNSLLKNHTPVNAACITGNLPRLSPLHLRLPPPRTSYSRTHPARPKMPSTSGFTASCALPEITSSKQEAKDVVLPRLASIHKSEFGAHLGLFAWPERLP
ncbi:unnamed protein product, partial [Fusarium graminearum]